MLNRIPTVAFNAPYLRKRIDFLTELGVRKLGHVLTRHPNLLAYAVEGNMQRKASAAPATLGGAPRRVRVWVPVAPGSRPQGSICRVAQTP